ncbi:aromatic hydrocarbon degradation protein [Hyphomicrobium methylovorum]|nr:aromatic hydrocarbon degradation protein [Hyphomicrobium methylovorum]
MRAAGLTQLVGASVIALSAAAPSAMAGGFDIQQQSTVFMGSSSAGNAAGGSIGSMFWNPAATAQYSGLNTESSYILVLPSGDVHVNSPTVFGRDSGEIGIDAVTSSSYGTYQFSKDLWLGMAINAPFGLATKPSDTTYAGSVLGQTTKLTTVNANPTIAYRIAPGITIGAGIQIEWARAKLRFDEVGGGFGNAQFKGDDWAFGATAGIMLEPARGTTIGLGYRSRMSHDFDGNLDQPIVGRASAVGSIDLPDIVTLSLRQEITPTMRLLGSVQWSNWSRFEQLTLTSPGLAPIGGALVVPANWNDGWMFAIGGEYDYSPFLTLRTGVSYEISPADSPEKRMTNIPDADRVWLSVGASYQWSDSITVDVAYSHIFVADESFSRSPASPFAIDQGPITGTIEGSADLLSVGLRTRW